MLNRDQQLQYFLSLDPLKKDKRQRKVVKKALKRIKRMEKQNVK